jgi:hypothetical protein
MGGDVTVTREPGKGSCSRCACRGARYPNQKPLTVSTETRDPMSALGKKQTSCHHLGMSALPPKADIESLLGFVRF